jgi:hypothetical protein
MVGHDATEFVGAQSKTERTQWDPEMRGDANTLGQQYRNCRQGLDAKEPKPPCRREKCFYLTSPFIEPSGAAATVSLVLPLDFQKNDFTGSKRAINMIETRMTFSP